MLWQDEMLRFDTGWPSAKVIDVKAEELILRFVSAGREETSSVASELLISSDCNATQFSNAKLSESVLRKPALAISE